MTTATITVVHAPACHFCADARTALAELGRDFALQLDLVPADSEVGLALTREHRPAMFPLVLVDGAFFSAGRLPRRKLRARLVARAAAQVGPSGLLNPAPGPKAGAPS